MKKILVKKLFYGLTAVMVAAEVMFANFFEVKGFTDNKEAAFFNYEDLIVQYYDCVNAARHKKVLEIYSDTLKSALTEFFQNPMNKTEKQGLFNVVHAEVKFIAKMNEWEHRIDNGVDFYDIKQYFVKCVMHVQETDKYYMEGDNYFLFTIGKEENGASSIMDIEIPSYREIRIYDPDCAEAYFNLRDYLLYGDSYAAPASLEADDTLVYVDSVRNPSSVRVLYNNAVHVVDFKTFMERTAAAEFNAELENADAYKAAAVAAKMFTIHRVLKRATGENYDFDAQGDEQQYSTTVELSVTARTALNETKDVFLLDCYGAVFPTFYRSEAAKFPQYCVKNGGIMPQKDPEHASLTWKEKLRYYYTMGDVAYYNPNMNYGALIITYAHTHDWSSGEYCNLCGAEAK